MAIVLDVVAVALALGGLAAYGLGALALARAEDVQALYWLVAGTVALRSAAHLLRPAGGRRA